MTKCQWLFYKPASVPKWPHLEKCNQDAEVEVKTDEGPKLFCFEHTLKVRKL